MTPDQTSLELARYQMKLAFRFLLICIEWKHALIIIVFVRKHLITMIMVCLGMSVHTARFL